MDENGLSHLKIQMPVTSDTARVKPEKHDQDQNSVLSEKLYASSVSSGDKSLAEKALVLAEGSAMGLVDHGLDRMVNNPGGFISEVAGAGALTLALRGPAWARIPAGAIALVGSTSFAMHTAEAGKATFKAVSSMTESNERATLQTVAAQMGPLIFDSMAMGVTAHLASKAPLPENLNLSGSIKSGLGRLQDNLGLSPELEMAGGFRLKAKDLPEHVMAMSMTATKSPEGINIHRGFGPSRETIQLVEFLRPGETVQIKHPDLSITKFSQDGTIRAGFSSGEGRILNLGGPINRVHVSEYGGGVKHVRINDSIEPSVVISRDKNSIRAILANGDHVHILDNVAGGFTKFDHNDGLKSWVEQSGRIVFQLPSGVMNETRVPGDLAMIKLTERPDGSKSFQFMDSQGRVNTNKVELPPTQQISKFEDLPLWSQMQRQARPQVQQAVEPVIGGSEVLRYEPSGQMRPHDRENDRGFFPWNTRFRPVSTMRVYDEQIAGVDRRVMPHDDLSSPASMGLAQQGHSNLITRFLANLGGRKDPLDPFND